MDTRTRKKQFEEKERDWLVQKFGLRGRLQRFDIIQAEPPFLSITQDIAESRPWDKGG